MYRPFSFLLGGQNKGSADVTVFNKADAVRNTGFFGISQRRIQTGIRRTDDDIRINRMFLRQKCACAFSCHMNAFALDNRVRTSGVNIFKHTDVALISTMCFNAANPVFVRNHNFTRTQVADKFCADAVKGTAFGSKHNVIAHFAHGKRSETVRVPCCNQLLRGHDNQGVSSLDFVH